MSKWRDLGKSAEKLNNQVREKLEKALNELDEQTKDIQSSAKELGKNIANAAEKLGQNIAEETREPREKIAHSLQNAGNEISKAAKLLAEKLKEGYFCIKNDEHHLAITKLGKVDCTYTNLEKMLQEKAHFASHTEYESGIISKISSGELNRESACSEEYTHHYAQLAQESVNTLINKCDYTHDEL